VILVGEMRRPRDDRDGDRSPRKPGHLVCRRCTTMDAAENDQPDRASFPPVQQKQIRPAAGFRPQGVVSAADCFPRGRPGAPFPGRGDPAEHRTGAGNTSRTKDKTPARSAEGDRAGYVSYRMQTFDQSLLTLLKGRAQSPSTRPCSQASNSDDFALPRPWVSSTSGPHVDDFEKGGPPQRRRGDAGRPPVAGIELAIGMLARRPLRAEESGPAARRARGRLKAGSPRFYRACGSWACSRTPRCAAGWRVRTRKRGATVPRRSHGSRSRRFSRELVERRFGRIASPGAVAEAAAIALRNEVPRRIPPGREGPRRRTGFWPGALSARRLPAAVGPVYDRNTQGD